MLCTHATASRIKTYKDCAFKYFLEYHLQLPSMREGNIYSEKGSAVHLALEKYANAVLGKDENAELDYKKTLIECYVESELWKLDDRKPEKGGDPYPQQKNCEQCPWYSKDSVCLVAKKKAALVDGCPRGNFDSDLELIEKTLNRTDYKPLETTEGEDGNLKFVKKILGVEQDFDLELNGVRVRGFMDLVIEVDENTVEVIDYKTGRSMSYNKARLDPQVRIYGAATRFLFPKYKYVMVTLYYLKSNPVTVCLSPEDDELTLQSLRNNYDVISGDRNPRQQKIWLCNYCIGYDTCKDVRKKFKKKGQFCLPILYCDYTNPYHDCWGNLYPIENQRVGLENIDKIKYACKGHTDFGRDYVGPKEYREEQPNDSSKTA